MHSGREAKAAARILLLDCDAQSAATIAGCLEAAAATPVCISSTGSGREAGSLLRGSAYDLVLLDLDSLADLALPREEAMIRLVRMAGAAMVITLSRGTSVSLSVSAMQAGAHDHMAKPLDGAALMARLRNLSRRHGLARALCRDAAAIEPQGPAETQPISIQPAMFPQREPQILPLWQQEQRIIEDAITKFSGNIARAAAALEISPSTIYRKRQIWEQLAVARKGAA